MPGIEKKLSETSYTTTDLWFSGIASVDGNGMTLEFVVYSISSRFLPVQRMLNEEIINMCQRNGIRLAVNRSLLETGGDPEEK